MNILIIGAGFAGSTAARLFAEQGHSVLVLEKRPHIGGNAFDEHDEFGVLVHRYGPHIFHTNSQVVFEFLSRFTKWRHYEHRVLASVEGNLYPFPINRITINRLYGLDLDELGVLEFLEKNKISREVKSSEDLVLSSVGPDLCEKFFRGYTKKQWGLDLKDLSAGVAARIPVRNNNDDRYFTDKFQAIPDQGYSKMFKNMLDHPNIGIKLGVDFFDTKNRYSFDYKIYTGPLDEYFGYKYGKLPYRSLNFEYKHMPGLDSFQEAAQINFPDSYEYTRITEFKKITGQIHSGTTIAYEFPVATGDPYYPIPRHQTEALARRYKDLAENVPDTTFVGRLAEYRYYNMDQVVGSVMKKVGSLFSIFD